MAFFHFNQNNSGGDFAFDGQRGVTHHVVIEAESANEANERARLIGLYFDGCVSGDDCPCCGDRWYEACGDGDDSPLLYGEPAIGWVPKFGRWMAPNPEAVIHYRDGRIEWVSGDPVQEATPQLSGTN